MVGITAVDGIPWIARCAINRRAAPRSIRCAAGKRTTAVLSVLTIWLVTLCSCSAQHKTPAPAQPVTGGQITPLLVSTLSTPRWFTGTDGQAHPAYELMLTNVVPVAVMLSAVEVH